MARGRQTAAMLRMMGIEELITRSADEYVARAVALLRDRDRLAGLQARIEASRDVLFEDETAIRGFEEFLEQAASMA
jgi:predicted O-linked N-acetylglucosamine transferase (SPINDLY family)